MPTDVLIDPASGQIYWNDGTGSPESIAIKGDAINTISFTGYSASFSPGSTPAGALTLVTVKDSAGTDALIPGTSGYNLGSSTLRWNTFATNANLSGTLVVSDSTISSSLLTGSTRINGGIAISGNASIGQSLNFYNTAATFYTGFKAGTISANTLYTLPTAFPGSASLLQSDASGTLTWVGSIGTATTATNVNVVSASTSASHPVLFTPSTGTASGAATSSNATLSYNPSSFVLSVSGLAVTNITPSFSTTTGALVVTGGVGIGGSIFTSPTSKSSISGVSFNNSRAENGFTINASSSYTFNIQDAANNQRLNYHADSNRTEFTGNNATHEIRLIHSNNSGYTGFKANSSGAVTYILPAGDGSNGQLLQTNGTGTLSWATVSGGAGSGSSGVNAGGQYQLAYYASTGGSVDGSSTFTNNTSTSTVTISHGTSSTATNIGALVVTGGLGLGGNAFIGGTVTVTNSTASTSTTTGALRVSGGVGIGGSIFGGSTISAADNIEIKSGKELRLNNSGNTFYTGIKAGSNASNTTYTFPVAFPGTGTSVLQSDTSGTLTWVAMASGSGSGLATTATNVQVNIIGNPNSFHPLLMTPVQSSAGSAVSANGTVLYNPSTDTLYTPGLAVTSGVDATNTTSGALQVRGGIGATGTSYFQTISVASLTGTGNAVINGNFTFNGVGVFGNATTDTINSLARYISDILPSADNSYDLGNNALGWRNFRVSGVGTVVTLSVTSSTVSTSTTTGALVVTGGVGIGGSLYTSIGSSSSVSGVTLANGNVSATTYNKLTLTAPATSATLTLANGSSLITSGGHSLTFNTSNTTSLTLPTTGTLATTSNKLSDFAATTSLELKNTISDETGSGALVFATSPDFTTSVTTGSATFSVFNATATNISAFGAATTLSIGAASGKATINSVDNSTSSITGAFVVTGGAAVGQSLSVAGRLQMFNGATNYTAFLSSASTPVTYTLPPTAPAGVGSSYLSASTAGVMAWVAAPTSGGGSPGGSNKQIQYNNASAFGGAAGFEYITAGIANTVSIFSASGTGYTSGMWIHSINGSTTRVGIGLSNPQFELEILGEISATNKSFVIDHPTKSGMKLRYGSLEGPENGVYVRGELNNSNIIEVPDHWIGLVHEDSYTVHLTPIGKYAQLYVVNIRNYNVEIADSNSLPIHCYYSVWAERKDIPKLVTEY